MAAQDHLSMHQTGEMVSRLSEHGGFTYDPRKKTFPTKGYTVAAHQAAELEVKGGISEDHLQGYIAGSAPTWSSGAQAPIPKGGSKKDRGKVMVGGWRSGDKDYVDLPKLYPDTPTGHQKSREAQVLRGQKAGFSLHDLADDPNPWSPRAPDKDEHQDISRLSAQFPEFAHMASKSPYLALQQPEIQAWTQGPTRRAGWEREKRRG